MSYIKSFWSKFLHLFLFLTLCFILFLNLHYSTIDYFIIRTSDMGIAKFCGSTGAFSCQKTLLSSFSDFGSGFPISEIAVLYFLFLTITLSWGSLRPLRKPLCLFGILISSLFMGIMFFYLKTLCKSCLLIHGCHLLLCGAALWKERLANGAKNPRFLSLILTSRTWIAPSVLTFAVCLQLTVLYDFFWIKELRQELQLGRSAAFEETGVMNEETFKKLKETATAFYPNQILQPESPTIYLFFDFLCPYCKESLQTYESWKQGSGKSIDIQVISFPLENGCNPSYAGEDYSGACLSQEVFFCLKHLGKWPLHHENLIRDSKGLFKDRSALKSFFWGTKTAWEEVASCLEQDQAWIKEEAKRHRELADSQGVLGTPVFLKIQAENGKYKVLRFNGAMSIHGWEMI